MRVSLLGVYGVHPAGRYWQQDGHVSCSAVHSAAERRLLLDGLARETSQQLDQNQPLGKRSVLYLVVWPFSGTLRVWTIMQMPRGSCQLSLQRTGWDLEDAPASHGSAPCSRIWDRTISHCLKQWIWPRTGLCGGRGRRMALRNVELHARDDDDDVCQGPTLSQWLICWSFRGCKNWPTPFPGRILHKVTKPGLFAALYLSMRYTVLLFIRAPFYLSLVSLLCVLSFGCRNSEDPVQTAFSLHCHIGDTEKKHFNAFIITRTKLT